MPPSNDANDANDASASRDLAALLARLDDPGFFAPLAPLAPRLARDEAPALAVDDAGVARAIAGPGFTRLDGVLDVADARALVSSIDALGAAGLPPLFVYAFDETWRVGARVADALSRALGVTYAMLPDAWAFRVAPGPAHAGWSPHRGSYELDVDRAAPSLVNVWVALTDATLDNSCMVVVPLDEDPAYPQDLRSHAASASSGTPLPIPAGAALAWNANVLHWGAPSTERARAPRVSITYTLAKAGAGDDRRDPHGLLDAGHAARLDVIAQQILVYADSERGFPDVLRRWASVRRTMADLARGQGKASVRKAP